MRLIVRRSLHSCLSSRLLRGASVFSPRFSQPAGPLSVVVGGSNVLKFCEQVACFAHVYFIFLLASGHAERAALFSHDASK